MRAGIGGENRKRRSDVIKTRTYLEGDGGGRWGPARGGHTAGPQTRGDAIMNDQKKSRSAGTFSVVTFPAPSQLKGAGFCACAWAAPSPALFLGHGEVLGPWVAGRGFPFT